MPPPQILLSGMPGKMCTEVARLLLLSPHAPRLLGFTLSSAKRHGEHLFFQDERFTLVGPQARDAVLPNGESVVAIDYSLPEAMVPNARWFCDNAIPFVMGTTGGDAAAIQRLVSTSQISAVLAPNMAIPIVLLQAAAEHLAREFPNALHGLNAKITESHQSTKTDTSGTAKAMVTHLNALGLPLTTDGIEKIRDPARQESEMHVPEQHLAGHAFHRYEIDSPDATLHLELRHNIIGRRAYAEGTLRALDFLLQKMAAGEKAHCHSMLDVLKVP